MPAFLEPLARGIYILRAGPNTHKVGDPYTASGTVVSIRLDVCEIRGFTSRLNTPSQMMRLYSGIRKCLLDAGFLEVRWERQRGFDVDFVKVRLRNGNMFRAPLLSSPS